MTSAMVTRVIVNAAAAKAGLSVGLS